MVQMHFLGLNALGYSVLVAKSGREAIEIFENNQDTINLVILDMIMPEMSGGETYDKLKEIKPEIKAILSSGYSLDGQAERIISRGCNDFIPKPFNMNELSEKIRRVLYQSSR